jgi:hypothetical protein
VRTRVLTPAHADVRRCVRCLAVGGLPSVAAASTPEVDAEASLAHAAPRGVPLHAALAAAAKAPHLHSWVADGATVAAAKRLLAARRREDAQRQAATARAAAAAARTSLSNACEIMQSAAADEAAAAARQAVADAVAAGSVPVFRSHALTTLTVAVPREADADGGSPLLRSFNPWFFSLAQLERVMAASLDDAARRAAARRATARRAAVAAKLDAARAAAAPRGRAPPGGAATAADAAPRSRADADAEDPSDSLEDGGGGGGEDNNQLIQEYTRDLGQSISTLSSGDDDAAPRAPASSALPDLPLGDRPAAAALLALSAVGGALSVPLGDAADALALRSGVGRRLLATGSLRRVRRDALVRVETYEQVAGRSLYGRKLLSEQDDADADADASDAPPPCTVPAPLFVAELGAEQLAQLAQLLRQENDDACA